MAHRRSASSVSDHVEMRAQSRRCQHMYNLVIGEVQLITSVMRLNRRWQTEPLDYQLSALSPRSSDRPGTSRARKGGAGSSSAPAANTPTNGPETLAVRRAKNLRLVRGFEVLRRTLSARNVLASMDRMQVVSPFVAVIASDDTSGLITGIALSSLQKFVEAGFFDEGRGGSVMALECIAEGVTNCRFEATDSTHDEVVLMKILQLEVACLQSAAIRFLSPDSMWQMVTTCFRIHREMRPPDYSELLCAAAEHTLTEMVRTLFSRLPQYVLGDPRHTHLGSPIIASFTEHQVLSTDSDEKHNNNFSPLRLDDSKAPRSPDQAMEKDMDAHRRDGLQVLVKVFEFLCSLAQSHMHSTEDRPSDMHDSSWFSRAALSSQLILTALEAGGRVFTRVPALLSRLEDEVCRFLLHNARSSNTVIFTLTLRIIFTLLALMRDRLSMQLEVILNSVFLRILTKAPRFSGAGGTGSNSSAGALRGTPANAYAIQEAALETLLDFSRLPWFLPELYCNFDCYPFSSNLFHNVFHGLCKCVFPVNGVLTGNHILALRCIVEALRLISQRCVRQVASSTSSAVAVALAGAFSDDDDEEVEDSQQATPLAVAAASALQAKAQGTSAPDKDRAPKLRDMAARVLYRDQQNAVFQLPSDASPAEIAEHLAITHTLKCQLAECVDAFNRKPKKGVLRLHELGFLPSLPKTKDDPELQGVAQLIAHFLRHAPGLEKTAIGLWLGDPSPLATASRERHIQLFDFSGQTLDNAMRMYLESFRLPKEAQQIDRCIGTFAARYYEQEPQFLDSLDVTHILAFSLIMLNTDAHNETVKNKMTFEQFLRNNRGINNGSDVSHDLQRQLYDAITQNEIQLTSEDTGTTDAIHDPLWTDLVRKARDQGRVYVRLREDRLSSVDRRVFEVGCDSAIAALSVAFDLYNGPGTQSPFDSNNSDSKSANAVPSDLEVDDDQAHHFDVMNLLQEGFLLMAGVATHFQHYEVVDLLNSKLGVHTTLLEDPSFNWDSRSRQLNRFSSRLKAQRAAQTLFLLVRKFGDGVRQSWRDVFLLIGQFYALEVLPADLTVLRDFTEHESQPVAPGTGNPNDVDETKSPAVAHTGDASTADVDPSANSSSSKASDASGSTGGDKDDRNHLTWRCPRREVLTYVPREVKMEYAKSSSLFQTVTSYLLSSSSGGTHKPRVLVVPHKSSSSHTSAALEQAQRCAADCAIVTMLRDTQFLSEVALLQLLSCLTELCSYENLVRPVEGSDFDYAHIVAPHTPDVAGSSVTATASSTGHATPVAGARTPNGIALSTADPSGSPTSGDVSDNDCATPTASGTDRPVVHIPPGTPHSEAFAQSVSGHSTPMSSARSASRGAGSGRHSLTTTLPRAGGLHEPFYSVIQSRFVPRPPLELRRILLYVELFTRVVLCNRSRVHLLWGTVLSLYRTLFNPTALLLPPTTTNLDRSSFHSDTERSILSPSSATPQPSLRSAPALSMSHSVPALNKLPTATSKSTSSAASVTTSSSSGPVTHKAVDNLHLALSPSITMVVEAGVVSLCTLVSHALLLDAASGAKKQSSTLGNRLRSAYQALALLLSVDLGPPDPVVVEPMAADNLSIERVLEQARESGASATVDNGGGSGRRNSTVRGTSRVYTGRFAPLRSLGQQFGGGLLHIVRTCRAHEVEHTAGGWAVLLKIMRRCARHRYCLDDGFKALLAVWGSTPSDLRKPSASHAPPDSAASSDPASTPQSPKVSSSAGQSSMPALSLTVQNWADHSEAGRMLDSDNFELYASLLGAFGSAPWGSAVERKNRAEWCVDQLMLLLAYLPSVLKDFDRSSSPGPVKRQLNMDSTSTGAAEEVKSPADHPKSASSTVPEPPAEWRLFQYPVFLALRLVAEHAPGAARHYALEKLQRALLSMQPLWHTSAADTPAAAPSASTRRDSIDSLTTPSKDAEQSFLRAYDRGIRMNPELATAMCWRGCLVEILFPLLTTLANQAEPTDEPAAVLAQDRILCLKLMCRIFLIHLPQFLSLHADFHITWVNVLNTLDLYIQKGQGTSLAESAEDSLKNLLLVMSSAGVFSPQHNTTGRELWDLTWAVIDPAHPHLKKKLFPTDAGGGQPLDATPAATLTPTLAPAHPSGSGGQPPLVSLDTPSL